MTNKTKYDFLPLGHIGKSFGLNGGFFVRLLNLESKSLKVGLGVKVVCATTMSEKFYTISKVLPKNRVYFEGITTIEEAQDLVASHIYIQRKDLPPIADSEVYLIDFLGFEVFDINDIFIGMVYAFSDNGAQSIVEIKLKNGSLKSVPFVKPIIQKIDEPEKTIVLDIPLGLLD